MKRSDCLIAAALSLVAPACAPVSVARPVASPATTTVRFCLSVDIRRDGPVCVDEISAEKQRHRASTLRIEEQGGRVLRERCVNGAGVPCVGASAHTYRYENGLLAARAESSDLGVPLGEHLYTSRPGGGALHTWRSVDGTGDTEIEALTWDTQGYIAESHFLDANGNPETDPDGVYGYRYTRDAKGRILKTEAVDTGGRPMLNKYSYCTQTQRFAPTGDLLELERLDIDGKPMREGVSRFVQENDVWGNTTKTSQFGADGEPLADAEKGASWTERRDERGNVVEVKYFGTRGEPFLVGPGAASSRTTYDAKGRPTQIDYYDAAGEPVRISRGYASLSQEYDDRGRLVEERARDEKGELVVGAAGWAILVHAYNEQGDEVLTSYRGPHQRPMVIPGSASSLAREVDGSHRLVGLTFLDELGKPKLLWRGYAAVRYRYDATGKRGPPLYLDGSGQPVEVLGLRVMRVAFAPPGPVVSVMRSRDEAKARVEEALARVRGGLAFVDAARLYGEDPDTAGTDMGEIAVSSMQPEIAKPARALPVGGISDVIETASAFFILLRVK